MSDFLFDTCLLSELIKPTPNRNVELWAKSVDPMASFLSAMSIGEVRKGIERRPHDARRAFLENWLSVDVPNAFRGRVLAFGSEVADLYGRIKAKADSNGRVVGVPDAIIAATALHYNLSVVTRNAGDFEPLGVSVVNPWLS